MNLRLFLVITVVLGAFFLGSPGAAAAPATGGFAANIVVKGTLGKPADVEVNGIQFATERPTDVYFLDQPFPGRANTGWHEHPGLVIVTIETGTVAFHDGCLVTQYSAGQTFVEPPMKSGMVENILDADAQVVSTGIFPVGSPRRINTPAPDCSGRAED